MTDPYSQQAPESGYSESLTYSIDSSSTKWRRSLDRYYYIKLPNGDFGKIEVLLSAFQLDRPTLLIYYCINPKVNSRFLSMPGQGQRPDGL